MRWTRWDSRRGQVAALALALAPGLALLAPATAQAKDKINGRVCDGDASPTVDPSGHVTWSCRSGGTIVSGDEVEHADPGGGGRGGGDREPRPRGRGKLPTRGGDPVPDPVPRQRPDPARS
jgi:hypothetical protein